MYHILMLSGGKDSTAMLLKGIETDLTIDEVVCIDTTKEFPQMYGHIEKLKSVCADKQIKFTQLKIKFDYYMYEHIKTKGANKGTKGYSWPDFKNRWCTSLKRQAGNRYIKELKKNKSIENVIEYHGISAEEIERTNKNKDNRTIKYPLRDWNMTGDDCLQYCYEKGFDWGGLYKKFHRVSCWCCPLSRIGELKTLYVDFPSLFDKLMDMDKKTYRKFRNDYSVEELEKKFTYRKS